MRRYLEYYASAMRIAVLEQIQYRVANYLYIIGMLTEPVVYLVVWSTIAQASGAEVGGYSALDFAAYYIIGSLVQHINIALSPYSWELRVRGGQLSGELLYPIHPLHHDIAYYAGSNLVTIILCLPTTAILIWIFKPVLEPTWYQCLTFALAALGGYLISTLELSLLGMATFWTTRAGAVFELFFATDLLLSGRMVPVTLLPAWVQNLTRWLPFQWTYYFPVESLVGGLPLSQLLLGLSIQVVWIGLGIVMVGWVWRSAIRRYTAVGN
jgi:ABC-2 type transport system permease protein